MFTRKMLLICWLVGSFATCLDEGVIGRVSEDCSSPCNTPPVDYCISDALYRSYAQTGQCRVEMQGCTYPFEEFPCPDCLTECLDVCEGVACPAIEGGCQVGFCNPVAEPIACSYQAVGDGASCTTGDGSGLPPGVCHGGACVASTPNQPPTVDAGTNTTILLGATVSLSGAISDDGLPDPPAATIATWSVQGAPGGAIVTFADANAANTTATLSAHGSYTLRLTGDDSELTAFADVEVEVDEPTPIATGTQYLGDEHAVDWDPGIPDGIPTYTTDVDVTDFGAVGNGTADDTQAIKDAISAAAVGHGVFLPPGNYRTTSKIRIKSGVVVRGSGWDVTTITCDHNSDSCFAFEYSYPPRDYTPLMSGYGKGSTVVQVQDVSGFVAGEFVEFRQDNDPALMRGMSVDRNPGQFTRVLAVDGPAKTLTIEKALHYDYNPAMNPGARHLTMVEDAGIEELRIELPLTTGTSLGNISFIGAANCWVKNVWSHMTYRGHINFKESYANEVRGCVFEDTWLRGGGGSGYGIRNGTRSSDSLFTDNIFWKLRHSMLLSYGTNGNVFSYSYSVDAAGGGDDQTEISSTWIYTDASSHGNYAYMNLFEGNWFQVAFMDNVHGTNASTSLFRNRITRQTVFVDEASRARFPFIIVAANNFYHSAVGNEIGLAGQQANGHPSHWTVDNGGTGSVIIWTDPEGADTILVHGNYEYLNNGYTLSATHNGWETSPGGENAPIPASLYLPSAPSWWPEGYVWPPFGLENVGSGNSLPAKDRFDALRAAGKI